MKPSLFVELCCGSAAVTLKLLGGTHAKPPVSYMGSKSGYAEPILWAMGLRSGMGADAVLLNDPGPWSKVWRVLTTPAGCKAVAAIIRGWIGEDARALWERLRAEAVPDDEGEAAARWVYLTGRSLGTQGAQVLDGQWKVNGFNAGGGWYTPKSGPAQGRPIQSLPPDAEDYAPRFDALSRLSFPPTTVLGLDAADLAPEFAAKYMQLLASNRLINGDWIDGEWGNTGKKRKPDGSAAWSSPSHGGDEYATSADVLAKRVEDVAAFMYLTRGSFRGKDPDAGMGIPQGQPACGTFGAVRPAADMLDAWMSEYDPHPAAVSNLPAQDIVPNPPLPPRTYVFIDPPYFGDGSRKITGYAHEFPRADVVAVAERWKAAGAVVCVSECVALPELMANGWHQMEITDLRKGQRRTFSKQSREFLTLSHPPQWTAPVQRGLFDGV